MPLRDDRLEAGHVLGRLSRAGAPGIGMTTYPVPPGHVTGEQDLCAAFDRLVWWWTEPGCIKVSDEQWQAEMDKWAAEALAGGGSGVDVDNGRLRCLQDGEMITEGPCVYVLKTHRGTITVPHTHLERVDHFPEVLA